MPIAVGAVANAGAINLDPSKKTLVIPFVADIGALIVVHAGVASETQTIASVTDDGLNVYTKKAAVLADYTDLYPQGLVPGADNPLNDFWIEGECWVTVATGATTVLTITTTDVARFAVEIESYTGTSFGAGLTATVVQGQAASIVFTTTASNSFVSAGFSCALAPNEAASTGTVRGQVEGANRDFAVGITTADNTKATAGACTVAIKPTTLDFLYGEDTFVPVPATYAVCAVEIKA